jgi:hypothetical protein
MPKSFFSINMPYGMRTHYNDEWLFFNREKMPLGWNTGSKTSFGSYDELLVLPIFTKYACLTQELLLKLSSNGEKGIKRNEDGKIEMVFFYKKNPSSNPDLLKDYFEKIKLISKCQVISKSRQ